MFVVFVFVLLCFFVVYLFLFYFGAHTSFTLTPNLMSTPVDCKFLSALCPMDASNWVQGKQTSEQTKANPVTRKHNT
jgi:hypothetical protein